MPRRQLIVNADDFGQTSGVTRGILQAHDNGIVTSTSFMVRWPAAANAAQAAQSRTRLSVGLHVDLGEWKLDDGQWVALYEVVPLSDAEAVAAEIRRQLDAFRRLMGRNPTHLDSHQHVHRQEPVKSFLLALAQELNIPLRHFSSDVRYCGAFYGQDESGQPLPEVFTLPYFTRILSSLPSTTTELACHPGFAGDLCSMYRDEREWELSILCDPGVKKAVASLDIELCSFQDLTAPVG